MMFALALVASAPVFVADEKSFFHMPGTEDFRTQTVSRTAGETEWPFTVDEGTLACAYVMGQRAVYFVEKTDTPEPRVVVLSTNPFDLALANLGRTELLTPRDDLATLVGRVAPFVQAGERLCEQPRGTTIGPGGEL